MRKLKLFFFIIVITPLLCAVFGIIHDQVTYTISEEYYTKFKFIQFHLVDDGMNMQMDHRQGAMIVGAMATWWMGIPIGLFYASILVFYPADGPLYRIYFRTVLLTFIITALLSFIGYLAWKFEWIGSTEGWFIPEDLSDRDSFICVGSIHNFSYIGGTAGLMAGIAYLVTGRGKLKK
jgi:hypothetical protein